MREVSYPYISGLHGQPSVDVGCILSPEQINMDTVVFIVYMRLEYLGLVVVAEFASRYLAESEVNIILTS